MCKRWASSGASGGRRSRGPASLLVVVNGIQFEQDVEMSLAGEVNDLRQVHAEHGGFVEVVLGQDAELRLADQLLRFVDIGSLKSSTLQSLSLDSS